MIYLLQVSTCWIFLYCIYALFFRNETFFSINRYYLLSSLVAGLLIPLIGTYLPANTTSDELYTVMYYTVVPTIEVTANDTSLLTWQTLIWAIYALGVVLVASKFVYGLSKIYEIYKSGISEKKDGYILVHTSKAHLPFSFFKYVFISKKVQIDGNLSHIIKHEQLHVNQWHSLDLLFTELLHVFFWFNPIMILYKKALRQSHEFLADAYVTDQEAKYSYGQLLLGQSTSGIEIALANQFFNSQIKKRIKMMYKKKSAKPALVKYLAAVPVLAVLLLVFSSHMKAHFDKAQVKQEVTHYFNTSQLSTDGIMAFTKELLERHPDQRTQLSEVFDELGQLKGYTIDLSPADEEHTLCVNYDGQTASTDHNKVTKEGKSWSEVSASLKFQKGGEITINSETLPGTFTVYADEVELIEGTDYKVDYSTGRLTVLTKKYLDEEIPLQVIFENSDAKTTDNANQPTKKSIPSNLLAQKGGYNLVADQITLVGFGDPAVDGDNQSKIGDPLIVIDGVIKGTDRTHHTDLDPDDIASMTILKGEAAVAKYGDRGKDGVIEITLKKVQNFAKNADEGLYPVVEEMPRFMGCEDIADKVERSECAKQKMLEFIYTNIQYPAEARESSVEGMVVVQFVVDKKGTVQDPRIVRAIGGGCDEAALSVVNKMPKWIPGKQSGKIVSVLYTLPVRFKLEGESQVEEKAVSSQEVDEEALFPGTDTKEASQKALLETVYQSIKYPSEARDNSIEGMNVINFTINSKGYITDYKVVRSIGWGTDEVCNELVEKLMDMKPWTPAQKDGEAVGMEYNLPIKFKLQGEKEETKSLPLTGPISKPNPNNGTFAIAFESTSKAPITINIYDLSGRVLRVYDAIIKVGMVEQQVDIQEYDVKSAIINVIQNGQIYAEKVLVNR